MPAILWCAPLLRCSAWQLHGTARLWACLGLGLGLPFWLCLAPTHPGLHLEGLQLEAQGMLPRRSLMVWLALLHPGIPLPQLLPPAAILHPTMT